MMVSDMKFACVFRDIVLTVSNEVDEIVQGVTGVIEFAPGYGKSCQSLFRAFEHLIPVF